MPASGDDQSKSGTIQGVTKAFNIIGTLQELDGARVNELADHMGLPTSTAHVYLKTLREAGYVKKQGQAYRLSLRFLEHGGFERRQMDIYRAAKFRINELAEETNEAANLGVEEDGQRVLIYKSEAPDDAVYDNAATGERTNMHWTALGKSLLAHLDEARIHEIVDQHGLPRATDQTITTREELLAECERIRDRGYAIEDEERRKGILAVGAAVFDSETNDVVGSICVSGPKTRMINGDGEVRSDVVEAVQNTANVTELRYNHY